MRHYVASGCGQDFQPVDIMCMQMDGVVRLQVAGSRHVVGDANANILLLLAGGWASSGGWVQPGDSGLRCWGWETNILLYLCKL